MNSLEIHLSKIDASLYSKLEETKAEVNLLLGKYATNFPNYTDHSIHHTMEVFKIASELMTEMEIKNLNSDETYILSMACLLHDIGMCVPQDKIKGFYELKEYESYKESFPTLTIQEFIRDVHHTLSKKFIIEEWELLKIPTKKFASAIGLVSEGHRKVDLGNFEVYEPCFFAKSGKEFICLPYLACILRIADELDVTNSRTPKILTKYYMPNNEVSLQEWAKHIATSQRNYLDNKVIFEVDCSDHNIYAALQDQFDKIQSVINYSQKILRAIPDLKVKHYELNLSLVEVKYNFLGFDPKGIKFSFDVQNVVTAFIGEDLYKEKLTSLREALQNSIDSCRYKSKVLKERYEPSISVFVDNNTIRIEDNGAGMDEFIIENYFGRLASSFYEQDKIKNQFEAIGQFGVGIFSYFLISEYIDVETKTSKNNTLKFRFDKDPKSYFHFFDKAERDTVGTTITMYLKKEIVGEFTFKNIEEYIRTIFPHIEIPIEINGFDNQTIVEFSPYEVSEEEVIKNRLKLQNRKLFDRFKVIVLNLNDEELEGVCALIIGKDLKEVFSVSSKYFDPEYFESTRSRHGLSQISVSQKGVFINNYSSSFLNFVIGDINLKKKIKINIDRNEFTDDDQFYSLINKYEYLLLRETFNIINKREYTLEDRHYITNNFLSNYYDYLFKQYDYTDKIAIIFKESLFMKVLMDNKIQISNLQRLIEQYQEFILISEKEEVNFIYNHFKKPVLIVNHDENFMFGIRDLLIEVMKLTPHIEVIQNKAYEFFNKNNDDSISTIEKKLNDLIQSYRDIIDAKTNKILVCTFFNKEEFKDFFYDDSFSINYNHFFIQFFKLNHDKIAVNKQYKKIVREAIDMIYEIQNLNKKIIPASIIRLNELLKPLKKISYLKEFTINDFIV